jgi:hypothetical protein
MPPVPPLPLRLSLPVLLPQASISVTDEIKASSLMCPPYLQVRKIVAPPTYVFVQRSDAMSVRSVMVS